MIYLCIKPIVPHAPKLSALDELFLRGTNMFQTRPYDWQPVDEDGNLDESWPASERPSSIR